MTLINFRLFRIKILEGGGYGRKYRGYDRNMGEIWVVNIGIIKYIGRITTKLFQKIKTTLELLT